MVRGDRKVQAILLISISMKRFRGGEETFLIF